MNNNRIALGKIGAHLGRSNFILELHASYIGSFPFFHELQVFDNNVQGRGQLNIMSMKCQYTNWLEPFMNNNMTIMGEIEAHLRGSSVTLVHHASYIGTLSLLHGIQVFWPIIYKEVANLTLCQFFGIYH